MNAERLEAMVLALGRGATITNTQTNAQRRDGGVEIRGADVNVGNDLIGGDRKAESGE